MTWDERGGPFGVCYYWRAWVSSYDLPLFWEYAPDMTTADGW